MPKLELQLAAEFGKNLLAQNEILECTIKEQQKMIEEKDIEIQYLRKHSMALKEVNESRLRCYDHVEESIITVEKENAVLKNQADLQKKQIKA